MFRVYATMDQRMAPSQVAAHARRAEALGYDGLNVPDAIHDGLTMATLALQATTRTAAYQYFEEDRKGSITPGKQADLVILGANPLLAEADTLKDIPIIEAFAPLKWPPV